MTPTKDVLEDSYVHRAQLDVKVEHLETQQERVEEKLDKVLGTLEAFRSQAGEFRDTILGRVSDTGRQLQEQSFALKALDKRVLDLEEVGKGKRKWVVDVVNLAINALLLIGVGYVMTAAHLKSP